MKYLRRYLSLLVCLALSLIVFSLPVNAEATDGVFNAYFYGGVYNFNASGGGSKNASATLIDGQYGVVDAMTTSNYTLNSSNWYGYYYVSVGYADSSIICRSGKSITLTVDNLYGVLYASNDSWGRSLLCPNEVYYILRYTDGTDSVFMSSKLTYTYSQTKGTYMFSLELEPQKDVQKVSFYSVFHPDLDAGLKDMDGTSGKVGISFGSMQTYPLVVSIEENDDTSGLLESIIAWFQELWETTSSGFANLVQGIKDLPGKIWEAIETGLKNLFVPDEAYIVGYKDKWDTLLADRLGAVYQATNLLFESWDRIGEADAKNSIDMPVVTIPLPGGNSFSFGGYNVQIVPSGFQWLATTLKGLIGVVCTLLFVNGLRNKYEEFMGVEE